ncbi:MAG TPA: CarD family transcriptional regulator [Blastocatellia bacterium]|nr:CarD family transcriptional regulator [Blastocatellia bacterium]
MNVGNKVNYPNQGPCLVASVVNREIAGNSMSFYRLALLDDSGGELFVPVTKVEESGLRQLLKTSEIPMLLEQLTKSGQVSKDWKQRARDHMKLLLSGSAFDLAEVVESLTTLNDCKALSVRESSILEKAKRLLVCEISEVMGNTKIAAEEMINGALNGRENVRHVARQVLTKEGTDG